VWGEGRREEVKDEGTKKESGWEGANSRWLIGNVKRYRDCSEII
jgi:hypothetical protein